MNYLNKKNKIILLLIILASFLLAGFFIIDWGSQKGLKILQKGGSTHFSEIWNKVVDYELNLEFEYPRSLTLERSLVNGMAGLKLYRPVGFGERLHCNESGTPNPHVVSDPEIYVEILPQTWDEFRDTQIKEFNLSPNEIDDWDKQYQEQTFDDGRPYHRNISGVEMCDFVNTYISINDHMVLIREPWYASFNTIITEGGQKIIEELRDDLPVIDEKVKKEIFSTFKSVKEKQNPNIDY